MVRDGKVQFLDKVILILNLIFIRFDAFLNNYIELTFLYIFLTLFGKFIEVQSLSANSIQLLLTLNALVISTHYIYSITYIINDILDFEDVQKLRVNEAKYSFYKLRPLVYYNRSLITVLYLVTLYIVFLILLSISFTSTILIYPPLLTALTLMHSKSKKFRSITFACLRILKYTLFFTLLHQYLHTTNIRFIIYAFLTLILLILPYHIVTYAKSKTLLWQTSLHHHVKPVIAVLFISFLVMLIQLVRLSIFIAFVKSLLITFTPFLITRQILRFILGATNPNLYVHIKRLVIFFIITLVLSSIILIAYVK
jgi:hypothetical protein